MAVGDEAGDGDEVAGGENRGANRVWLNAGGAQGGTAGEYVDSGQSLGTSDSLGVSLGDVDGDGDLDAWVANAVDQRHRVRGGAAEAEGGTG